jgi:hypothetical protein
MLGLHDSSKGAVNDRRITQASGTLRAFLWITNLLALVCYIFAILFLPYLSLIDSLVRSSTYAVLLMVTGLWVIEIRWAGQHNQFTWNEAIAVIGLVGVAAPWLIVLTGPVILIIGCIRQKSAHKSIFNAAINTIAITVASGFYSAVVHQPLGVPPAGLTQVFNSSDITGLLVAGATYSFTTHVFVQVVMALSSGDRIRDVLTDGLALQTIIMCGNLAVAFALITEARWRPYLIIPTLVTAVAVHFSYVAWLNHRLDRELWERADQAVGQLNASLDTDDVLAAAVRGAAQLFRASSVDIMIPLSVPTAAGDHRIVRGTAHGVLSDEVICAPIKGAPVDHQKPGSLASHDAPGNPARLDSVVP